MGETMTRFLRVMSRTVKGSSMGGNAGCFIDDRPGVSQPASFHNHPASSIAQTQVFMADALGACHERVGKLLDLHAAVALHVFKPLGRVAGGVLDFQHLDAAAGFVAFQHLRHVMSTWQIHWPGQSHLPKPIWCRCQWRSAPYAPHRPSKRWEHLCPSI